MGKLSNWPALVRESVAPDWVYSLRTGLYAPNPDWGKDLICWEKGGVDRWGYERWHEKGCGSRKAKSPDTNNWAETVLAVARWLRDNDIATSGEVQSRTVEAYWDIVERLSEITMTRAIAHRSLLILEANNDNPKIENRDDWAVYCWMWVYQCRWSEQDAPEWFIAELNAHANTMIDFNRNFIDIDGDWSVAQ
jgi:hypothetical protein